MNWPSRLIQRVETLAQTHDQMVQRWQDSPTGFGRTIRAIQCVGFGTFAVVFGRTAVAMSQAILTWGGLSIRIKKLRIWNLQRRIAALEARARRSPYEAPRVGQALVCFFTPAKHRESAVIEMQIGFEFNVDRIGRRAAQNAYWWEILRNTYAFVGGSKIAMGLGIGGAGLAALSKFLGS